MCSDMTDAAARRRSHSIHDTVRRIASPEVETHSKDPLMSFEIPRLGRNVFVPRRGRDSHAGKLSPLVL